MTHRDVRRTTLGIDLGDKQSDVCVLGSEGTVVRRFRVKTTSSGFQGRLAHWAGARAVVEVGTHSPWVSRLLSAMGFEVIVANANKVGLIGHSFKKTDAHDAEVLAKLGQLDPSLLSPIQHRSETAQKDLMMLRARDGVVASRTQMVNSVRGFVKALGQRCPSSSTSKFTERVRESLEEGLFPGLAELLEVIDVLSEKIRRPGSGGEGRVSPLPGDVSAAADLGGRSHDGAMLRAHARGSSSLRSESGRGEFLGPGAAATGVWRA